MSDTNSLFLLPFFLWLDGGYSPRTHSKHRHGLGDRHGLSDRLGPAREETLGQNKLFNITRLPFIYPRVTWRCFCGSDPKELCSRFGSGLALAEWVT